MFIIEGLGAQLAARWGALIRDQLGLADDQVSFLLYHGGNDDRHLDKLEQALGAAELDDRMVDRIVKTAKVTARLYLLAAGRAGQCLSAGAAGGRVRRLLPGRRAGDLHRLPPRAIASIGRAREVAGTHAGDAGAAGRDAHPVGRQPPLPPRARRSAGRSPLARATASGTRTTAGTSAARTRSPACSTRWPDRCASCSTACTARAPTSSTSRWRPTSPPIPGTASSAAPARTWRSRSRTSPSSSAARPGCSGGRASRRCG